MPIGSSIRPHLAAGLLCAAQLLLAAPFAAAEPAMIFQHLSSAQGLPQNTVMQTLQDSQGFIWIATEDGLVRYDGFDVRRYAHERDQNDSLPGNFVWAMAEDRAGDLWLAMKDAGLAHWSRRTDRFTSYRRDPAHRDGLSSDSLRALIIDRHGHLWIGTTGGGADEFDPAKGSFRHYAHDAARPDSLSSNVVTSLWEDPDGQIWIGTDDGLNRLIPESHTFRRYRADPADPHSLSSSRVSAIRTDQRGRLWIGTYDGGLDLYDRNSETFTAYRHRVEDGGSIASDEVRALLSDRAGRLWVGTAEGLALRDERNDRFGNYARSASDPSTLPDNYVMSLFQDRSGLLWVGTRSGGVSRWNPATWSLGHQRPAALGGAYVMSFAEDAGGRLWLGSFGSGLLRFDPATGACAPLDAIAGGGQRLADSRVMSLAMDRDGNLWIGTMSGGLSRLGAAGHLDTWRADAANANSPSPSAIMALLAHSGGRIWLGTFGAGVEILDPVSGRLQRVTHDPHDARSLSGPRATAFAEDADGNVWVGTEGGGLDLLRPDGTVAAVFQHRPDDPASLAANTIYSLHVDRRGRVWVGTDGGGLDLVQGSAAHPERIHFKNLSQRDGLTSDVVYGVESDEQGALWLSGNAGLVRYDPTSGELHAFHRQHGLQGEEFDFGAHQRTRSGMLAFGGPNGFNLFDPTNVLQRPASPTVVLTNLELLNKPAATALPYPLLDKLELGYRDSMATFEFAALDYTAPAGNRYAYRLRGFDKEWVTLRQRHSVTFTNLDAGNYVLEVKAAVGDGPWGPVALSLPIAVSPAPWRTWWAFAGYAAGLCLVLYGWHRLQRRKLAEVAEAGRRLELEVAERTAQLRDRNAELDRVNKVKSDFMARMSHEIRSPMNGVIGTLELLMRTPQSAHQAKLTTTAKTSANSLLRILNEILDLAKVEAGKLHLELAPFDLAAVIEETTQLLAPQADAKQLELVVSAAPDLDRLVVGDALRVQQMLTNLVGNAIKFTDRGEVVVTAALTDADNADEIEVTITVRDTGIGMTREALERVFEPFAQADESTTRRFGGTGLGLAICREIATLMGASITGESEPDRGSVFTLRLRLPCADQIARHDAGTLAGARALIASRRPSLIAAIASEARSWDLAIEPLPADLDVAAHLAKANAGGKAARIDVVLLDVDSMPEELLQAREPPAARPAYVFLCSGAQELRTRAESIGGTAAVVGKPVRRAELHDALGRALGRTTAAGDATGASGMHASLQAHVLVAEDNPVNRTITEGFLHEIGCSVTCVPDGRSAVTRASSGAFDLILMDLQMPDIDGFAATGLIRKAEAAARGRRTPIIAVTANASSLHRDACVAAGMDDFLGKPFYLEDLRAVLQRWAPEHTRRSEERPVRAAPLAPEAAHSILDPAMIAGIRAMARPGQASLFTRLVGLFAASSRRQLDELRAALDRNDLQAAAAACHALKGGAGNVGAAGFAAAARDTELACLASDGAAADRLARELERLHSTAIAALEAEALRESA